MGLYWALLLLLPLQLPLLLLLPLLPAASFERAVVGLDQKLLVRPWPHSKLSAAARQLVQEC